MSDKFTVLFDFRIQPGRTRSRKTRSALDVTNSVELGPWIDNFDNQKKLNDMRLFYVLKPNAENVVKFGVAGTNGGTGAFGRLRQYIHSYGYSDDLNRCRGVQLMYLAGNKYNPRVELVKSDVFKKELAAKRYFRAPEVKAHLIGRGFERFDLDRLQELFDIIDDQSNKDFGDVETERRVSERLAQQNLTADDYVVRITSHTTKGGKSKAMTQYTCYWNRPAVLTQKKLIKKLNPNPKKNSDLRDLQADREQEAARFQTEETSRVEDHTTKEFYKNIILFKNGSKAMEIYKALHPEGKFRDWTYIYNVIYPYLRGGARARVEVLAGAAAAFFLAGAFFLGGAFFLAGAFFLPAWHLFSPVLKQQLVIYISYYVFNFN